MQRADEFVEEVSSVNALSLHRLGNLLSPYRYIRWPKFNDCGLDGGGTDAEFFKGIHLVLHQGDQGGNDNAHPRAAQGGDLVA